MPNPQNDLIQQRSLECSSINDDLYKIIERYNNFFNNIKLDIGFSAREFDQTFCDSIEDCVNNLENIYLKFSSVEKYLKKSIGLNALIDDSIKDEFK